MHEPSIFVGLTKADGVVRVGQYHSIGRYGLRDHVERAVDQLRCKDVRAARRIVRHYMRDVHNVPENQIEVEETKETSIYADFHATI